MLDWQKIEPELDKPGSKKPSFVKILKPEDLEYIIDIFQAKKQLSKVEVGLFELVPGSLQKSCRQYLQKG